MITSIFLIDQWNIFKHQWLLKYLLLSQNFDIIHCFCFVILIIFCEGLEFWKSLDVIKFNVKLQIFGSLTKWNQQILWFWIFEPIPFRILFVVKFQIFFSIFELYQIFQTWITCFFVDQQSSSIKSWIKFICLFFIYWYLNLLRID